MNVLNRLMAGLAAVVLTATAFALPDLDRPHTAVSLVSYQGITHVAKAVLVTAVHAVAAR
jgi:hypothetical protein